MSYGMTIADFVQQVYYAIYKVRLDVRHDAALPQAFHANTDKFKEVVFEANFVLQELQKEQDWNWLRERLDLGCTCQSHHGEIQEFELPDWVYKPCTGFNDSVRLRNKNSSLFMEVPFTSPRSGNTFITAMHDEYGRINVNDTRVAAFQVGNALTFTRPWQGNEIGKKIETDVVRRFEPLHICDDSCQQPCRYSYQQKVFTEIPDPYYMVVRTAAKRAEGDPSVTDRVVSLADDATKIMSAMRENDSSKTMTDTYRTSSIGYMRVM